MKTIPSGIWDRLICPQCGGDVCVNTHVITCERCNIRFPALPTEGYDVRLRRPRTYQRPAITVGAPPVQALPSFERLTEAAMGKMPMRIAPELAARFPQASSKKSLMLDIGCGKMIHRELCERYGYNYVGLDYEETGVMFQGDAQALPFKDATFEFVLSIAVLQEVPHPEIMIREALRVLTPGGVLIATSSYLETYLKIRHHFSHIALYDLLVEEGFVVEVVAPNPRWTILESLLYNGIFPLMPKPVAKALVMPLVLLHRLWWFLGGFVSPKATDHNRLLLTTGSFFFVARKPQGNV